MADVKKQREREILDEVYAHRNFFEIEAHEAPDFLIRIHPGAEQFGVEITEFYLTEGQARLKQIDGYIDHLLAGGDVRHKDDRQHFKVSAITILSKDGDVKVPDVPAIQTVVKPLGELARQVAEIIKDKDRVHDTAPRYLAHINLIIRDRHGILRHHPSEEFGGLFCTSDLGQAVLASRFREIYFVSTFKEGEGFVPLRTVLTLAKMYTVYDFLKASMSNDVLEDLNGFMRWFASYLSAITGTGVRIRDEEGALELLHGNAGFLLSEPGVKVRDYAESILPESLLVEPDPNWDDLGAHSGMPCYEETVVYESGIVFAVRTGESMGGAPP